MNTVVAQRIRGSLPTPPHFALVILSQSINAMGHLTRLLPLLLFFFVVGASQEAAAQTRAYSQYERGVIQDALKATDGEVDPAPEGKAIEQVVIHRMPVFDLRDPVPQMVNIFHATTREYVIKRELLFRTRDVYRERVIQETARNLRGRRQISLVLILALRGSRSDKVRVLVITKDVWSLRMNSNFEFDSEGLNFLFLSPSEENIFGTHSKLGAVYFWTRRSYSLGLVARHPPSCRQSCCGCRQWELDLQSGNERGGGVIRSFQFWSAAILYPGKMGLGP